MKDMRGVTLKVGDCVLAINSMCMDHGILKVKEFTERRGETYAVLDCPDWEVASEDILVLPKEYSYNEQ